MLFLQQLLSIQSLQSRLPENIKIVVLDSIQKELSHSITVKLTSPSVDKLPRSRRRHKFQGPADIPCDWLISNRPHHLVKTFLTDGEIGHFWHEMPG